VALLDRLIAQGFDASYEQQHGSVRLGCSRCDALSIQGIACHETGCPNVVRGDEKGCDDE
jgi:hypothetical protein